MSSKTKPSTAVASVEEAPKAVATIDMNALIAEDAETAAPQFEKADLALPFLRILQALSPQVQEGDAAFVPNARPGMFFNTVTNEAFPGNPGLVIIPVSYERSITEWTKREDGGGFLKDHGSDDSGFQFTERDEKGRDITPEGTQLVRAGLYYALALRPDGSVMQVAVSMASTQLKKSRKWNSLMASTRVPHPTTGTPITPAPFYFAYQFATAREENEVGSWYGFKIEPLKPTLELPEGQSLYLMARAFRELVVKKEVKISHVEGLGGEVSEVEAEVESF